MKCPSDWKGISIIRIISPACGTLRQASSVSSAWHVELANATERTKTAIFKTLYECA